MPEPASLSPYRVSTRTRCRAAAHELRGHIHWPVTQHATLQRDNKNGNKNASENIKHKRRLILSESSGVVNGGQLGSWLQVMQGTYGRWAGADLPADGTLCVADWFLAVTLAFESGPPAQRTTCSYWELSSPRSCVEWRLSGRSRSSNLGSVEHVFQAGGLRR